jgi:hypothetical protein
MMMIFKIKKLIVLFILIVVNISCSTQKTDSFSIDSFLPEGEKKCEALRVKVNERRDSLFAQMQNGISKDSDWFIEYSSNRESGESLEYDTRLGVSEDEYNELLKLLKEVEYEVFEEGNVEIFKENEIISFKSEGYFELLNYLTIDKNSKIAYLDGYVLELKDSSFVESDKNAFRSSWEGLNWEYELNDKENGNFLQNTLKVGRLKTNNRTFITIKMKEIEGGVTIFSGELRVLLD